LPLLDPGLLQALLEAGRQGGVAEATLAADDGSTIALGRIAMGYDGGQLFDEPGV
jgi:hypothetical protein